jgi:Zn-dependent peptidase ImmA (M78 family)
VEDIPNVTLEDLTAAEIEKRAQEPASGVTDRAPNGDLRIAINKNSSRAHRRFTLAHELAHVITFEHAHVIFSRLGFRDKELRAYRIEKICDCFAAELLMPSALVKRVWSLPVQDVRALAAEFGVSEDAMNIRIRTLGLVDDEKDRPVHQWFKKPGLVLTRNH